MFRVLVLVLVSNVLAEAPLRPGHIKYSDDNGIKVDWKLYAPYTQFKSQIQRHYERRDEGKATAKVEPRVVRPTGNQARVRAELLGHEQEQPVRYKPFSQVPNPLKQLLMESYEAQAPYVDHEAFFHRLPVPQQSVPPERQGVGYQSEIVRPETRDQQSEIISEARTSSAHQSLFFDKSVPAEIQRLLKYQAQIPYNVIANHIVYKPETPFVPEPLPDDEIGPYKYRSRVYYAYRPNYKEDQAEPVSEESDRKSSYLTAAVK
ncbi:uncharacterized protein LOC124414713 isoform X2 [Diprion similis]|uniref:uncharacterized protein LOC124414713 isoform X2 n=1 Tax=Diprion similis TaxID=362088 RepID=UPI001EF8857C|nr:uncharacterized protein LOC124414713 isoform X2 [Diprion similis]